MTLDGLTLQIRNAVAYGILYPFLLSSATWFSYTSFPPLLYFFLTLWLFLVSLDSFLLLSLFFLLFSLSVLLLDLHSEKLFPFNFHHPFLADLTCLVQVVVF